MHIWDYWYFSWFRKGRWIRDQIANICWVIEKAREFQKNIYFCFIDYTKAFDCVDHNKLWKILKEMGIPDHLTSLLRNLYAGQEAVVKTGHGRTDWFQTGKGVHQGCILSTCFFNLYAHYIMRNARLDEDKLESRLLGEISTTSDMKMIPPLWQLLRDTHKYEKPKHQSSSVQSLSMSNSLTPWPGFSVHHQLLELAQTYVHRVDDAIQPSHPLSSPSPPALNLSQDQGLFQWVGSSNRGPKNWSFSFIISPSNEYSGLISSRMDWLDLLAVQGTLKSLQHHSSKASILRRSDFFMVQLSHPYMTPGKIHSLD